MHRKVFILLFFIGNFLKLSGQTQSAYIKVGDNAFAKKDYVSALQLYQQALEYDDDDAELIFKVAETHRNLFSFETASAWYQKAMVADRQREIPEIFLRYAEVLRYSRKFEDARNNIQIYHGLISNNDSLSRVAIADSLLIEQSAQMVKDSLPVNILNAGSVINSAYSDFAQHLTADSTLYFSSMRFPIQTNRSTEIVSKIMSSTLVGNTFAKPSVLSNEINQPSFHNCNASISPDNKLMIFSRCNYNETNELICALYESKFANGKWQNPIRLNDSINVKGFTSTQACITTNLAEGYILFFVSDRKGGKGQLDLWQCKRDASGNYSPPKNLNSVNTTGNEITPTFDHSNNTLYFSSDSLGGAGNYDVFKNVFINSEPTTSVNVGYPLNTGYNDIYFTPDLKDNKQGYLTSNRPGSHSLNGSYPCYDIYSYNITEPVVAKENTDSIKPIAVKVATENSEEMLEPLTSWLPLKLYFDNDYPDPRSRKPTTYSAYDQLYNQYFEKLGNYIEGFAGNNKNVKEEAQSAIENFFSSSLQYNFNRLETFAERLLASLNKGDTLELTIRGTASPLAESQYNVILSHRRINSLINYWKKWNNGLLTQYLESKQLIIDADAAGENLAPSSVSDRVDDKANSVFNPAAALERRIELTDIKIKKGRQSP